MALVLIVGVLAVSITVATKLIGNNGEDSNGTSPFENVNIEEYMSAASEIRNLEFRQDVSMETMSEENPRNYLERQLEGSYPEGLGKEEKTLRAFGLMPEGVDLRESFLQLHSQSTAGFYDSKKDKFYIVGDTKSLNNQISKITIVHELTHALQDQHFNLQSLLRHENNDDLSLAVKGLIEGDATYTMIEYLIQSSGISDKVSESYIDKYLNSLEGSFESFYKDENIPMFLVKTLQFQYLQGLSFVKEARDGSWERINQIYGDLPTSTEQILHPEKYLDNRDYPTVLELPSLENTLGSGWTSLQNNNMGEYMIGVLFQEYFPAADEDSANRESRYGWDGDSYLSYFNSEENRLALVWLSIWDTEGDAMEFRERYRSLLMKKYPDAKIALDNRNSLILDLGEIRMLLERAGKEILVLEGIPSSKLQQLRDKIFAETDKKVLRHANPDS